jgi:acyl dehydratase
MVTINGLDELRGKVGEELGVSDWRRITQEDIDRFADVTGDHQWIHVDPERAKDSPFRTTIAHGYFTLALHPVLADEVVRFDGFAFAVNYGLNRLRFPAPLPAGGRVRLRMALAGVEDIKGGAQATLGLTFEREDGDKPVAVAESVVRLYESR